MERTSSSLVVRKIVIDFTCMFVVGICVLLFWLYGKPYQRGFFCNDESLQHPELNSTVSSPMLYVVGMLLPITTIMAGEFIHTRNLAGQSPISIAGHGVPPWVVSSYAKIGVFGFGAASTALTTDVAKYSIGRLRPHFLMACEPNVDCTDPKYHHKYIEHFTCTAPDLNPRKLKEMRLSFPSGHSSFSAYTMIYLALYLQLRFTWEGSKLLRHVVQFLCLLLAWFTAMSRVSDYKHHWSDVLAGCSIGTLVAFIMVFCVGDLFKERRTRKKMDSEEKLRVADYECQDNAGTQVNNGTANRIC